MGGWTKGKPPSMPVRHFGRSCASRTPPNARQVPFPGISAESSDQPTETIVFSGSTVMEPSLPARFTHAWRHGVRPRAVSRNRRGDGGSQ